MHFVLELHDLSSKTASFSCRFSCNFAFKICGANVFRRETNLFSPASKRSENAKSGVSARYPRTALDPHHPSICTVMGSSPHAERVLAPVILNVCPETSRNYPIAFCIVTPDDTIASLIMSTIAAFVHLPLETLAAQGPVVLPSRRRSLSYSRMM